ncbi:peptide-methionine (S)-S-oxide reductase MsrA [Dokdonella sp.]|uniref:peptide-methionine (S)-S-oxide reductase MsrA n=1 Tax=Dokdonella sp. TaxID=2291710 RepID=UPI003C6FF1D2
MSLRSRLSRTLPLTILLMAFVSACAEQAEDSSAPVLPGEQAAGSLPASASGADEAVAIFAGGCFWCMEPPFDKLPGVKSTTSGYIGGRTPNPSYEQVSSGGTGHAEAVRIVYDPRTVTYQELLGVFWRNIDPYAVNYQFCDHGDQYRSAIFALDAEQLKLAVQSKLELEDAQHFGKPLATQVVAASTFYPAEDYHQDYYVKNPVRYKYYRYSCGRDKRLEQVWGTPAH